MKRRGMATVMAIVLIGVLAAVLTVVAAHAVSEQRRAALATDQIQASRLLAAMAQIARQQIADAKPVDGPVESPVGHASLTWHGGACAVSVDAGRVRRDVTLTFASGRIVHAE